MVKSMLTNNNVFIQRGHVSREDRNLLNLHKSGVIWLTGLSASGKSTIAYNVEKALFDLKIRAYVLDGDNIRYGLNQDLGFGREDRKENIRRVVDVSKILADTGMIVLCSFITPYEEERIFIREHLNGFNLIQVYVKASIDVCESRDPKGLYKKARAGLIKNYTGVSAPYEEPQNPDLVVNTAELNVQESVAEVLNYLRTINFLGIK